MKTFYKLAVALFFFFCGPVCTGSRQTYAIERLRDSNINKIAMWSETDKSLGYKCVAVIPEVQ